MDGAKMNGDDYVIDGNLAFSNTKDALKFYQTEYHKQQAEIEALKAKKLNDLYVDGEIAGWIGYYEGKVCTFIFKEEDVPEFLKNTEPVGKVRPVYTTPRIKP